MKFALRISENPILCEFDGVCSRSRLSSILVFERRWGGGEREGSGWGKEASLPAFFCEP